MSWVNRRERTMKSSVDSSEPPTWRFGRVNSTKVPSRLGTLQGWVSGFPVPGAHRPGQVGLDIGAVTTHFIGGDEMPVMSAIEGAFCRSALWRSFARRRVLPWALDGHSLTGDVLEIGGGSGAMAASMARAHPHVRLTVTDVDDTMVSAARARLSHDANVAVQVADVTDLPFADASFDAVTSYLMLHHVIAWPDALREAGRALRPGGQLVGYDLTDTHVARWIHRADGSPHRLIAVDELADGLTMAGLASFIVRPSFAGHLMRFSAEKPR